MLYPSGFLRFHLREHSNITDSIHILFSNHLQVFVYKDTTVFLKLESTLFQEACRGADADTHYDEVGRERGSAISQDNAPDFACITFGGDELRNFGAHVELNACGFVILEYVQMHQSEQILIDRGEIPYLHEPLPDFRT